MLFIYLLNIINTVYVVYMPYMEIISYIRLLLKKTIRKLDKTFYSGEWKQWPQLMTWHNKHRII
jgi:hypothetical protein